MNYFSTRGGATAKTSSAAIIRGIAPDGGLFIPESIPTIPSDEIEKRTKDTYIDWAEFVLSKLLPDFKKDTLSACISAAYGEGFDHSDVAPLKKLDDQLYALELWHGPTAAFKDMALQLLPHLMSQSLKMEDIKEKALILVATSGDTGKAALQGFQDIEQTEVCVYYPKDGVAKLQELQMSTQQGDNVHVVAVEGNFDDTQTGVKQIFTDQDMIQALRSKNYVFSSANSINFGRLAPQIVYYFTAYASLLRYGDIQMGDLVDFVVPTGNFGNILAGWYAKKMGLPVGTLICASNQNNVLYEFFKTGCYDTNRKFYKTISPSMDILVSSNLERLLYEVSGRDHERVSQWMDTLTDGGSYQINKELHDALLNDFDFGWVNEEETMTSIRRAWEKHGYLCDPHTAVAFAVNENVANTGHKRVILSTASPYKFVSDVLAALGKRRGNDCFDDIEALSDLSKTTAPQTIARLKNAKVLHHATCKAPDMGEKLLDLL